MQRLDLLFGLAARSPENLPPDGILRKMRLP